MADFPCIAFGMIVLNGEPFVHYNLRALYPFAHEIIVVEGAVQEAAANASAEGHSLDGTLETLRRFKAEEDPENKVVIITRDGFWAEKDAMSQAYAERATGDYLWQIDADEFYLPDDMARIITMLRDDPTITQVSFMLYSFWGSIDYISDGWFMRRKSLFPQINRIFKWGAGYHYTTHRPPTVVNPQGKTLQDGHWIDGFATERMGIRMYHYSLVFPAQVHAKSAYYQQATWNPNSAMEDWADNNYMKLRHPFRVHNVYTYPSWLERFTQAQPPQIEALWQDVQSGKIAIATRDNSDVERLLNNPCYIIARFLVKHSDGLAVALRPVRKFLGRQRLRLLSGLRRTRNIMIPQKRDKSV